MPYNRWSSFCSEIIGLTCGRKTPCWTGGNRNGSLLAIWILNKDIYEGCGWQSPGRWDAHFRTRGWAWEERVDSPEESRPMGLTSNENLRANWILEQYAFMKPVDDMTRCWTKWPGRNQTIWRDSMRLRADWIYSKDVYEGYGERASKDRVAIPPVGENTLQG